MAKDGGVEDLMDLEAKHQKARNILQSLDSVIVAYSGGIDSALVLRLAMDTLGDQAIGVTADSASVPRKELSEAKRLASDMGARHLVIQTEEFKNENYTSNPGNRCYYCKTELYGKLRDLAREKGVQHIANGTNVDDLGDHRPGLIAADELQVISPLRDAGLTKAEVRELAKQLGMEVWDKPASPCLSSRVPYGSVVTLEKLSNIEDAESFIDGLGIRERRVRHFGKKARIEVNASDLKTVQNALPGIEERFRELGFEEVEVTEFRSGNLNAALGVKA
jgi:uncharacterized protein